MKYFVPVCVCLLITSQVLAQRNCASSEYLQQQLQANPLLAQKIAAIEATRGSEVTLNGTDAPSTAATVVKIPVVVHVLYNNQNQNISDAQIRSQIAVLNKDFRKQNADTVFIPAAFKQLAADCQIEFELAKISPSGRATTGITRRQTSIQMYGLDDRIKFTNRGGEDAWDSDQYLNIWVGNLAGGLLGYASTLGCDKNIDGVAISPTAFGTMGIAAAPYNKGRTATHEIGHWLGLRHIWGDTYCGDDHIDDTPPQRNANRHCPTGVIITCGNNGDMYTNYMDLTDDACLNLFTQGQRNKIQELFKPGAARYALLSSKALTGTPINDPVQPADDPVELAPALSVKVYPNPAITTITIEGKDGELIGKTVTLRNHLGQLALQMKISKGNAPISIQHLADGMYFLRIEGSGQVIKLLKGK